MIKREKDTNELTDELFQTLHPLGKTNKRIARRKYDTIKSTILVVLHAKTLTHNELFAELEKRLTGTFDGNVSWYAETVKLDLEARKLIQRTNSRPKKYRLAQSPLISGEN